MAAASAARRFLRAHLHTWGVTEEDPASSIVDSVSLVVTELVTNALKVCEKGVSVMVIAHHDHLGIRVRDDSPETALLGHPELYDTHGRGLMIVSAVAADWGQQKIDDHKVIWARIDIPTGSALGAPCAYAR